MYLIMSEEYKKASQSEREKAFNGCGLDNDIIPDSILGVDITQACQIHDWDYVQGKTEKDRRIADLNFLKNLKTLITAKSSIFNFLRLAIAGIYFAAVRAFGSPVFFDKATT